jgi:DNA-binding SARP family transcriptional activator
MKDRGEFSKAGGYYVSADTLAEESEDLPMLGYIYRAWADLNRRLKNYPAALEWMQRAEGLANQETEITRVNDRVFQGALWEETGHSREAVEMLRDAAKGLADLQAPSSAVAASRFLLARSLFRTGDRAATEACLREAFDLAFAGGSDQGLVRDVGSSMDLLEAFVTHPTLGGYCAALIERSNKQLRIDRPEVPTTAGEEKSMVLSVKALGALEISWTGSAIPRSAWTSQKTKEVFLYLVDRAPVAREELLSVFWQEMPAGRGQANLYQTLYRIRRAIGADILLLREQVCRLAENVMVEYDVAEFEKAAREASARPVTDARRLTELEKAASLFRGEYLKDVPVDWASRRREEINQLFLSVIREAADECIALCRYEEGRAYAARGLEVDPFRDDLHQRMLSILAAMGRKHEVVDHYQQYVFLLRNDLGLDPPLETRALYDSLIS